MNKKLLYTVICILVLMIISNVILISMIIDYKNSIPVMIDNSTKNAVKELKVYDKIDSLIELKVGSIKLVNGKDGKDGVDGLNGNDGSKGETGTSIKGDTGLSAYQIAINNGFIGTEEEWLESLKPVVSNGLNSIPRCNISKNRQEYRYSIEDSWEILRDENNNPVPCTINK